ncbi:MAG: DUF5668 domain-containing protein [Chitinophagaceae bacterium]
MSDRDYRRQARDERRALRRSRTGNNIMIGMLVIGFGALMLLKQVGIFFPSWLFTWPMILIVVGLVAGAKSNFRDFSWLILIAIGGIFLVDEMDFDFSLRPFIWPIAIIGFGLLLITRGRCKNNRWYNPDNNTSQPPFTETPPSSSSYTSEPSRPQVPGASAYTSQVPIDDAIDIVSVFSGVKRTIYSKNFRGGEVVCVFGGADINLIQADIATPVIIEVVQIFGGVKLIVPPHWTIRTEATPIFGSVEDKRPPMNAGSDKVLIIRGVVLFGGVEIKSY